MAGNEEESGVLNEEESVERLTESNSVNRTVTLSEIPSKPFAVTVEVPLFLTMLGLALVGTPITNILMHRICLLTLNHTESECKVFLSPDKTNATKHLEEEVQKYLTLVSTVKAVLESLIPAVLSFFLGVWSDTHGRKPLIVWPLLGTALSSMMVVVFSLMKSYGPWWFILTAIPFSLSGGYIVLFTGAFCYMSDITSSKSRSLRMTLLQATVPAGIVLGSILTSYLLRAVGNVYLLLIGSCITVMAYAYTAVHVRESLTGALDGGITSVLDFLLVKEMFRECFKRRPNNGRAQILLVTFANCLSVFLLYGIAGLEYMYVREKIHWALKQYTLFSAASTTISFVGSFFGVAVIQKLFGISDLTLVIIGFLSATAESLTRAFAVYGWHMYLGAGISFLKNLSAPLIRSFLTKTLPIEDIAKVFALMGALEGISPLISPAIFNFLYASTIDVFPGAIYILSSVITVVCVVMVCFVQYYVWRGSRAPAYSRLEQTVVAEAYKCA